MSGGFKRSALFGLIGVFVVAAIVIAIATQTGGGEANPKTTYALIFGVIAVFLVVLFALQRADLNRVSGADARGAPEAIGAALAEVPNSTRWKRVAVEGGPGGIVIARKSGEQSDWLCDLWLAERLAAC